MLVRTSPAGSDEFAELLAGRLSELAVVPPADIDLSLKSHPPKIRTGRAFPHLTTIESFKSLPSPAKPKASHSPAKPKVSQKVKKLLGTVAKGFAHIPIFQGQHGPRGPSGIQHDGPALGSRSSPPVPGSQSGSSVANFFGWSPMSRAPADVMGFDASAVPSVLPNVAR